MVCRRPWLAALVLATLGVRVAPAGECGDAFELDTCTKESSATHMCERTGEAKLALAPRGGCGGFLQAACEVSTCSRATDSVPCQQRTAHDCSHYHGEYGKTDLARSACNAAPGCVWCGLGHLDVGQDDDSTGQLAAPLTLAADGSMGIDGFYDGWTIKVAKDGASPPSQFAAIASYDGSTQVFTVVGTFSTPTDSTWQYQVRRARSPPLPLSPQPPSTRFGLRPPSVTPSVPRAAPAPPAVRGAPARRRRPGPSAFLRVPRSFRPRRRTARRPGRRP